MAKLSTTSTEMGDPGYRTEETDPRQFHIDHTLAVLRSEISEYVLDDTVPFYDKIYALDATLRGGIRAYATNTAAENLHKAEGRSVLLKATSWDSGRSALLRTSALLVGRLDEEQPWQFIDRSDSAGHPAIDLQANFASVRAISDTNTYEHSSYNQSSMRSETAPTTRELSTDRIPVGLPLGPVGAENLYAKLQNFAATIRVGALAMHQEVEQIQAGVSLEKRLALHAAVTLAVVETARS